MYRRRLLLTLLAAVIAAAGTLVAQGQAPADDESLWRDFIVWYKASPPDRNFLAGYTAMLRGRGMTEIEAQQRLSRLMKQIFQRSDWAEVYFDKAFARPVTGRPEEDGYPLTPSALLIETVSGLPPGAALDAGMGQGRNAVYLANKGWRVTGFDISEQALAVARANAERAAVRFDMLKAGYGDFAFGNARWDLVVLTFAWAPVTDPAFVARLRASLRSGGRIVFEHFLEDPDSPRPAVMQALKPGQLREAFGDFTIERYEEVEGVGEWGGPGMRLVRMVAVKK
jgi:2-polyprenyl-3-methyl-5-hydroxy-6-metoxy-1,4-benzoquinol methylase